MTAVKAIAPRQTNYVLLGSYATLVILWGASQVVYINFITHLIVMVTTILYAGCHASLTLREDPNADTGDASEHSKSSAQRETLKKEEAMQFPIIGSLSLFLFYLAFKFLDKDMVNLLIGAYFSVVGCLALTMTVLPFFERISPSFLKRTVSWDYKVNHSLPESVAGPSPWDLSAEFSIMEALVLIGSAVVCGFYFQTKRWFLNNILGMAFCLQGIERFSVGSYKIAVILLCGLFFYDIFWVFGTDVMVTVAKNLDGPIKVLFPRSFEKDETGKIPMSLLGLGDIVIPGFFLSLLLRFDAEQAQQPVTNIDVHASFPKPYFYTGLLSYLVGIGMTLFIMLYFEAAQPALLYLVPACVGGSLLCAIVRGEIKELLAYDESDEEEEKEESKPKETEDSTAKKEK